MTFKHSNSIRKWGVIAFKALLSGYLVWFIATYVDWSSVVDSLRTVKLSFVVLALLLMIPNIFFHWLKWDYLIRLMYPTIKKRRTFFSAISGITMDTMLISTVGDYAGKILGLSEIPKGSLVALNFFDKLQLLVITIFTGSVSFIIMANMGLFDKATSSIMLIIGWISVIASIFLLIFSLAPRFYIRFAKFISRYKNIHTSDAYQASQILRNEDAFYIFFVNCLKFLTFNTQFYLVLLGFDYLSVNHAFLGTTAMFFSKSVLNGISISDLSTRGASAVFFFTQMGISATIALNTAVLVFLINRLIPSLGGFVVMLFLDIKYNPIKRRIKLYGIRKNRRTRLPQSNNQISV